MGPSVLVPAGPQARQSMGARPLPRAGGRCPDPRARHVRALLSHRFRRQGGELRRHLHGRCPLEERGPAVRAVDWKLGTGATRGLWPKQKELMMRIVLSAAILSAALAG